MSEPMVEMPLRHAQELRSTINALTARVTKLRAAMGSARNNFNCPAHIREWLDNALRQDEADNALQDPGTAHERLY